MKLFGIRLRPKGDKATGIKQLDPADRSAVTRARYVDREMRRLRQSGVDALTAELLVSDFVAAIRDEQK